LENINIHGDPKEGHRWTTAVKTRLSDMATVAE